MSYNVAQIVSAPHFSGCLASPTKCSCYTQQGTSLDVDKQTCLSVINQNNMPFNPFKKDSDDKPYSPDLDSADNQINEYKQAVTIGKQTQKDIIAYNQKRDESWNNVSPALQNSQKSNNMRGI